jgi:Domain of unknown function (DUF4145)
MQTFYPPKYKDSSFNCPNCGVYAKQTWLNTVGSTNGMQVSIRALAIAHCGHCDNYSFWYDQVMIFPSNNNVPLPNIDLPQDIKDDYKEASDILAKSPRGASAILRLTIQKLCKHLGESGDNINADIANLVKKGLPERIQKALDIVRVVGNNAVHPGHIEMKDNHDLAFALFGLINVIADSMISQPKKIEEMFNALPENLINGIKKRDGV